MEGQHEALPPHLQPLSHLRGQRHTRHLQPFHHPIPQILLGRTVLSSALRSQHQLRHHTQTGQRAIRIRQLKTPSRQLMPFRPRLTIRSCTRSDAAQRGDEGVGIDGRLALGFGVVRIVLRVQGTEVRCVHGNAPYRTDSNATDKGGGRCGLENRYVPDRRIRRSPRTARHGNANGLPAGATQTVAPAGKRIHLVHRRVFESRATLLRWHAKVYSHGCEMPRNRRPQRPQMLTLTALLHGARVAEPLRCSGFGRC